MNTQHFGCVKRWQPVGDMRCGLFFAVLRSDLLLDHLGTRMLFGGIHDVKCWQVEVGRMLRP
jgi:hypothetical protein